MTPKSALKLRIKAAAKARHWDEKPVIVNYGKCNWKAVWLRLGEKRIIINGASGRLKAEGAVYAALAIMLGIK